MSVVALSTYRPCWSSPDRGRVPGGDEDELTMAVAAVRPLREAHPGISRIVIVTREPTMLRGDTPVVVATALGDPGMVVEEHLGGGPAVLELLASAGEGTVVVGVSTSPPAGSAAALIGPEGAGGLVRPAGAVARGLPLVIERPHDLAPRTYDDPRLLRERGWRPAVEMLSSLPGPTGTVAPGTVAPGDGPVVVVGAPSRLGASPPISGELSEAVDVAGAAAPLFALDLLADRGTAGRLVGVEGAAARAVDVASPSLVRRYRTERAAQAPFPVVHDRSVEIPVSLAAYERAFEAKVGLRAGSCACGHLEYPPRYRCLACGREGLTELVDLPRAGSVYSVVTVRTQVPGTSTPYSLAVVEIERTPVRVLVQVTGVTPGTVAIGDRGELVFRKVADRQGVPDYGYAFQPEEVAA